MESPITIAIGNIIPHMYAGWAGGAKMVQPGVTSALTTGRTHLIAGPRVYEILGNVDNEVRKEMEDHRHAIRPQIHCQRRARRLRARWLESWPATWSRLIAQALNRSPHLHHRSSRTGRHRRRQLASGRSRSLAGLQAGQQLRNAGQGRRNAHPDDSRAGRHRARSHATCGLRHDARRQGDGDGERRRSADEVAAATYLAFDQTRERITIALVSDGIPNSEARKIGITATTDFNKALAAALAQTWQQGAHRRGHRRAQTSWRISRRKERRKNATICSKSVNDVQRGAVSRSLPCGSGGGIQGGGVSVSVRALARRGKNKAKAAGTEIVLFNMPAGNWGAGERGITGLPGTRSGVSRGRGEGARICRAPGNAPASCHGGHCSRRRGSWPLPRHARSPT